MTTIDKSFSPWNSFKRTHMPICKCNSSCRYSDSIWDSSSYTVKTEYNFYNTPYSFMDGFKCGIGGFLGGVAGGILTNIFGGFNGGGCFGGGCINQLLNPNLAMNQAMQYNNGWFGC